MRAFKRNIQDLTARISRIPALQTAYSRFKTYRTHLFKTVGALGLIAVVVAGGNQYVHANMKEVFHVYVDSKEAGIVSDPEVVEQFVLEKVKQLARENPGVHKVLNADSVSFKSERAFKMESNDRAALEQLDLLLVVTTVGVKLKVDGKLVAVVKDTETAQLILQQIQNKYVPAQANRGQVSILSVPVMASQGEVPPSGTVLESVEIDQDIEMEVVEIEPEDIVQPEAVVQKLITGDVKPTKYIVKEGDCVSCIAEKFNLSTEKIYELNPWIKNDFLDLGDELDLTILQPTLSVRTVEKVWEDEEMEHDTNFTTDSTMLAGQTRITKPGKNGFKRVAFQLTKVNGELVAEEFVDEAILEEPIAAEAIKGTKVILGEGTGKFAWPVVSARITSTYGKRWGTTHKGVDLISSNKSILAADNGEVSFAGKKNGYGNVIIIDHNNGYETLYGHLSKISV
ncbi:MAG TPA: M23 family metallopeptidase, partial [Bacilli bacterium]